MLRQIRNWFLRRRFREGAIISRFIARDVRREVQVISAARIDEGIITARARTNNVLYVINNLVREAEFGPEMEVEIEKLWEWTGKSWGGLADGTSIVDHSRGRDGDS